MIYNPEKELDAQRAVEKLKYFISKKKVFELIQKRVPKTYPQIKYVHLILGWFALEYGETLAYVKLEYLKKLVNPEIFEFEFTNQKTGEVRTEYKSCADLRKDELSMAITRFRDYSSKEAGIYLPGPEDLAILQQIEREINNNKQYI
jgi:hypothetical protein